MDNFYFIFVTPFIIWHKRVDVVRKKSFGHFPGGNGSQNKGWLQFLWILIYQIPHHRVTKKIQLRPELRFTKPK